MNLNESIMLTNGRRFEDFSYAYSVINAAPHSMVYAIPIYAPITEVHDNIVGCPGAFNETISGMYNLTKLGVAVEIRVVMTQQNVDLLHDLANFIGWNLPMVTHVAFMGMETHGRAESNKDNVWVEPLDYMDELGRAIRELRRRDIRTSIYNLPLCLLPKHLWTFSRQSISSWKQGYIDECNECSKKIECAGVFTTSCGLPKGINKF